jgi:cytochrome P450
MNMTVSELPVYNPFAPGFREDPYPHLHRLRSVDPIHWSPWWGSWVLTRYEDIRFVLGDQRFQLALEMLEARVPFITRDTAQPWFRILRKQILSADPPLHTRIRAIMAKGFTPGRMEQMRSVIQRCADECIDRGLESGRIDLISEFAHRLPFQVICEIMGVPVRDRAMLESHTHGLVRSTDVTPMAADELYRCNQATLTFRDYFVEFAKERAEKAPENIFDDMLAARADDKLSEEELIANVLLLFIAAHDTSVNLFGNGLWALFQNPDQLALLRNDPSLIRPALEELLRYDTSVTTARRTAIADVQLRDRTICAGQYVLCVLNAGNRDPEVFEEPDRLNILRKNVRPLSFGGGIHHCLGSQLARLEGQIGFTSLFARIPELELETDNPTWSQNTVIRGLESLPARCKRDVGGQAVSTVDRAQEELVKARGIEWLKYDERTTFFTYALQYLNWECVEGDILEFGVAVGKSLGLLARLHQENLHTWRYPEEPVHMRRFAGYDSLTGLPPDIHPHPRWKAGSFANNYLYGHPSMAYDEPITAEKLQELFRVCGLPRPELEIGWFEDTIPATIPSKYKKAALVHVDSDLYSSALCVLEGVAPILANGALVCFDDWFMYQGDPNQGEAKALTDFLARHPEWQAIPYKSYSVFCNSFIFRRTPGL